MLLMDATTLTGRGRQNLRWVFLHRVLQGNPFEDTFSSQHELGYFAEMFS